MARKAKCDDGRRGADCVFAAALKLGMSFFVRRLCSCAFGSHSEKARRFCKQKIAKAACFLFFQALLWLRFFRYCLIPTLLVRGRLAIRNKRIASTRFHRRPPISRGFRQKKSAGKFSPRVAFGGRMCYNKIGKMHGLRTPRGDKNRRRRSRTEKGRPPVGRSKRRVRAAC